jgi:TP901 family phage tail tape measure protein
VANNINLVVQMQAAQALAALQKMGNQLDALTAAEKRAAAGTNGHESAMQRWMRTGTKFGNQLQWTGRQLQYNWTLPILASGTAMGAWALANEKATKRVAKVYGDLQLPQEIGTDGVQRELDALSKSFVQLSNRYGQAQSEVINIAADWAAAGASGVALAKDTEISLKAMVLGEMDATEATSALISIQAQYGLSAEGLSDTLNELNIVENQTGISMQGLIEGFERTAGVARNAGIGTGELAAMLAAMVPAAGSAANAGNGLRTIISRLLAPTNEDGD